jgi:hypothetical protein
MITPGDNLMTMARAHLVDYTGRMFREGKAAVSAELSGTFERLGSNDELWWSRIEKLGKGRPLRRFFAASRERLLDRDTTPPASHALFRRGRVSRGTARWSDDR